MTKRTQAMILFISIGLLLTAKAGLAIWHSDADTARPVTIQQATAQTVIPVTVTPHPAPHNAPVPAAAAANPGDSWAMLENYLIPEAKAASVLSTAPPVIEDKTLASLRQYKDKLEQRSRQLDARAKSLQQAEEKLKQRITELEQLEASIQQRLADEAKVKNKKIKRLTAVYEGMKPERAAPVIAKMELSTVVKIFLLMNEKKVGKILSYLPPEKAVKISQALTRQISSVQ